MLRKFRPRARQVFDMNFLGFSLIDVSGVTVVCSSFFFRNNGSRRRREPLIPRGSQERFYNDGSSFVAISRAREKGGVSKFSLSWKLITVCWRKVGREREMGRVWKGNYFPGNSSRGRLAKGDLKLGLLSLQFASSQLRRRHSPAISATLETHCGPSCCARCSDETPYKWKCLSSGANHESLSLSLFIV